MPEWGVRQGHVLDVLRTLEPESVQCVVTSPPYWGLRDYGVAGQITLRQLRGIKAGMALADPEPESGGSTNG